MIALASGDWSARVEPALGGAILDLVWRDRAVFRPTPEGADDVLATACFPLVPYPNRIADGRFTFEGVDVILPVLPAFAPHALHGDAWRHPWTVESWDGDRVRMALDWPGTDAGSMEGWPWPWRALQTVSLNPGGLEVELSVTNTGDRAMPAGLGLHPYFRRTGDTRLRLEASGVWLTDVREIPDRLANPSTLIDWAEGVDVSQAPFVDHAYAGWTGKAVLEGEGRRVVLKADGAGWTQIYAPRGDDYLCVEPVTHRPDAAHAPADEKSGLVRLEPGQTLALAMKIEAGDLEDPR